ncbi:hypothetical protein FUA26_04305 [Seonamhaeicola algicola]|uniref:Uncharacterized protein n=1 Tax=Seonamhaeicola algicola TaxID=1719036 RepID=A0A5C7AZ81_9FLAO|nr:DUF6168 family protein [Seonamhaeicola algicola]TXE13023.1 hypothetical protein FUA26_04305 [Seonamhaeicola algicola]
MIKRVAFFALAIVVLFIAFYFIHSYVLNANEIALVFSLLKVYLYYAVSAIFVYSIVEVVSAKLPNQAGYAFLASIFLKIGFFVLIFQSTIFTNEPLTKPERFSLVIPLFLFLIAETVAISKLLNNK